MHSVFVHYSAPLLCAQGKKCVSLGNDLSEMKGHAQKYQPLYLGSRRCQRQRLKSELLY